MYLTDATITVSLDTDYDFQLNAELIVSRDSAIGGTLSQYLWGKHERFTVPLRYLSGNDAAQLNEWWADTDELVFYYDSTSYDVYIINQERPVQSLEKPYQDTWQGDLELGER